MIEAEGNRPTGHGHAEITTRSVMVAGRSTSGLSVIVFASVGSQERPMGFFASPVVSKIWIDAMFVEVVNDGVGRRFAVAGHRHHGGRADVDFGDGVVDVFFVRVMFGKLRRKRRALVTEIHVFRREQFVERDVDVGHNRTPIVKNVKSRFRPSES